METVLSFRIFLRTRREGFESRVFHLWWGANNSFINNGNIEAVTRPVNLATSSDEAKGLLSNSFKKVIA